MEKTRGYDNLSLDISMGSGFTPLFLSSIYQRSINNGTKRNTQNIRLDKKKEEKKKIELILLQQNNMQTGIKTNNPTKKVYTLDLVSNKNSNDAAISPKTADLLRVNAEGHNNAENTSNKDTLQSLLKEDTKKASHTRKKKRGKEASSSLQKANTKTNITTDNLVDKACTFQSASKKDTENVSVSPKTTDLSSTNRTDHNNAGNTNDKDTSTSESIPKGDTRKSTSLGAKKKESKRALNYSRKNDSQISNSDDEAHSLQIVNNCNNVMPKIADLSNTRTLKHKSAEKINDKDTSILQSSQCTFYDIDYTFYEINHAMIDTFALNIYFSLCADERKTYCLVCDRTFQIHNNRNLRQHLCSHIKSRKHIELLSDMIEDHKTLIKDGKIFSKLTLARECMRSKNDIVECLLCDSKKSLSKIHNSDESLHEHIASSMHQNFKVSWTSSVKTVLQDIHNYFQSGYNARKYRCEFCNYESTSEMYFAKHLRVIYHATRLIEIPDHAEKYKFHFCAACLLLWFGDSETYDRHNEQIEHKRRILYSSDLEHLSEEVLQFVIFSEQVVETLFIQSHNVCTYYNKPINNILYSLVTDLREYLPNIKAYPFGSRISDLAFPDSDLDIFLDCDNMYDGRNSSHSKCQNLIALIACYLSQNKTWKVQEIILQSRTPIVKVLHLPSGLISDISVTNGLAVENTKLIKCFNNVFPPCRKLILFLKRWLRLCDLLGSHFMTSYALTWCVIFYLQTLQVFPSISELIKLRNSSWRISGWKVGVSYDIPIRRIDHSFRELLLGFFIFYGDFKYKSHVVCPLLGRLIEKSAFSNLSTLPEEMAPYVAYMRDTCTQEKPQAFSLSPLCVQDPFDLSHNITKAMYHRKLNKLQNSCIYSAKVLKKTFPYLKSPLLS